MNMIIQVPAAWLPHVHRERIFWFWTPNDWSVTNPISNESCFALRTPNVLLEVTALRPREVPDNTNPAVFIAGFLKQSIIDSHPDTRVIQEGPHTPPAFDKSDALLRMKSFGLLAGYDFVAEMLRPESGYRIIFDYGEEESFQSTTDCYSLYRGDLVLLLNMKTTSSLYSKQGPIFEQVASTVMMGSLA